MQFTIRNAAIQDLDVITAIEASCFPAAEAAGREAFSVRIRTFAESFFIAEDEEGHIIGFINGCVTDQKAICDEMFEDCSYHHPDGAYQSIFGLDVSPVCRHQGVASGLMRHMIEETRTRGKKGLILTCKDRLIPFYQSFGYEKLGISASVHGGAVWYDMLLEF